MSVFEDFWRSGPFFEWNNNGYEFQDLSGYRYWKKYYLEYPIDFFAWNFVQQYIGQGPCLDSDDDDYIEECWEYAEWFRPAFVLIMTAIFCCVTSALVLMGFVWKNAMEYSGGYEYMVD